jgi:hypothetical protein
MLGAAAGRSWKNLQTKGCQGCKESRPALKYADTGSWPEQRGRLHYSTQDRKLFVEWRNGPEESKETGGHPTERKAIREENDFASYKHPGLPKKARPVLLPSVRTLGNLNFVYRHPSIYS